MGVKQKQAAKLWKTGLLPLNNTFFFLQKWRHAFPEKREHSLTVVDAYTNVCWDSEFSAFRTLFVRIRDILNCFLSIASSSYSLGSPWMRTGKQNLWKIYILFALTGTPNFKHGRTVFVQASLAWTSWSAIDNFVHWFSGKLNLDTCWLLLFRYWLFYSFTCSLMLWLRHFCVAERLHPLIMPPLLLHSLSVSAVHARNNNNNNNDNSSSNYNNN